MKNSKLKREIVILKKMCFPMPFGPINREIETGSGLTLLCIQTLVFNLSCGSTLA